MYRTIFIGLIAGWIAGKMTKGEGFGFWGNLFIGVIGSFVGEWIFSLLDLRATGTIGSILSASVGAITFLFIWKKLTK